MSTEQKPATPPQAANEPKPEPNSLATALSDGWGKFTRGELLSYPVMALILLVVAGGGGLWWYMHEQRKAASGRWREFDGLSSTADLQKYTEEKSNANTIQAKLAKLEIARIHLGPEGIDRMFVKGEDIQRDNPLEGEKKAREMRDAAVKSVETARDEFAKLVDEFKHDPIIKVECLLGSAKAEAVLVGIPKPGQLTERLGNPAKAVEWLDKVAAEAPDTDWGKDAKKLADVLRNQNTAEQVATLQASLFNVTASLSPPKLPGFPGMPPGMPGFPGHP